MIYIVVCLFYLLIDRRKQSIAKILVLFLLASSISAFLVGRQPSLSFDVSIYVIYNAILLLILFSSFKYYSGIKRFTDQHLSEGRLKDIDNLIIVVGISTLIINIYIFTKVYSLLLLESITVQEYKNEGGAAEIFSLYVPPFVISLSNLFSPVGYVSLTQHFYYLIKGRTKKSIVHFLISLLISLSGLLALSRSSTITYLLLYFTVFYFVYPLINKRLRKRIMIFSGIFVLAILSVFTTISKSRFSEQYTKKSLNESVIDNEKQPMLFSTLDYFSLWQENGPIIMQNHKPEYKYWGLYNSSGLAVQIQKVIHGSEKVKFEREVKFYKILGSYSNSFHGNIARLVYDFGFLGTVLFILLYSFIIRKLRPKNGVLNYKTLLFLPVVLPFCISFFLGNALGQLSLNIAIVYAICVYYLVFPKNCTVTASQRINLSA